MSKRPELKIVSGARSGFRFAVRAGGIRLGRSSSNDVSISDEEMSRNHCQIEPSGENGLRVIDLKSANGTFVNGREIGSEICELEVGDLIEIGCTQIRVVGDEPPAARPEKVDLGLGPRVDAGMAPPAAPKRSPVMKYVWLAVLLALGGAAFLVWRLPPAEQPSPAPLADAEQDELREVYYEKVEADAEGIFRFEMTLSSSGVLRAAVDDVPRENRHLNKSLPLGEKARAELGDILDWRKLREFDREYVGVEPDPPALSSWTLRVVYAGRARTVRIVNTQEPETFRAIRERLEAFSKNELGIWAMQYSRDKLVALAEAAIELGRSKWAERDVSHGNVFAALSAYREANFYLETVNPKPPCSAEARAGYDEAVAELDRRYRDRRFLADRAINLRQWETARDELGVLLELVPDRADDRYREAAAKLIDVEKRLKGGN